MTNQSSPSAHSPDAFLRLLCTLSIADSQWRRELATALQSLDLSEPQFLLLWHCRASRQQPLAQAELITRLAVSPAAVSGLVEVLSQKQLLEGQRDPNDRRRQCWTITSAGSRRLQQATAAVAAWTQRKFDPSAHGRFAGLAESLAGLTHMGRPPQRAAA